MRKISPLLVLCLIIFSSAPSLAGNSNYGAIPVPQLLARSGSSAGHWIQLFNGENLAGWTAKVKGYRAGENFGNTFRVEAGLLTVSYDHYTDFQQRFGHLFYDTPYSHYILSLDYRFTGKQLTDGPGWAYENSGAMIHSQSALSMGLDQDFPISVEVQFLGGSREAKRPTANVCTPGTHIEMKGVLTTDHCIESHSKTYSGNQWVHIDIVVLGDQFIEHRVNGQRVMHYARPQVGGGVVSGFLNAEKQDGRALNTGYISLQSESHPIQFRKVELLNLTGCGDPSADNYRNYLARHDAAVCE
ncbi:MAG: DUF1080 domain-containing protein [Halieaceae bacterium]|nr:DUF1080 domain-containing protein [Halieaceae bacterium]